MESDIPIDELVVLFMQYLQDKMERKADALSSVSSNFSFKAYENHSNFNDEGSPENALLFEGNSVSVISGKSSSLDVRGFKPFNNTHFNTHYSLKVTRLLATLHAFLRVNRIRSLLELDVRQNHRKMSLDKRVIITSDKSTATCRTKHSETQDSSECSLRDPAAQSDWVNLISQSSLVTSNLSILCSHFEEANISPLVVDKLKSLSGDIGTLTEFVNFVSTMQTKNLVQSVGPIAMCDIWVAESDQEGGEDESSFVIRLRGGPKLFTPPMRDVTWIWLTLIEPQILRDRHAELCETYCTAFNNTVRRLGILENTSYLTHFDVMRDLGDSFLHAFLTVVHKFTICGVWALDRQLFTTHGIRSLAQSVEFLVENGIIGSIFIA